MIRQFAKKASQAVQHFAVVVVVIVIAINMHVHVCSCLSVSVLGVAVRHVRHEQWSTLI